MHHTPLETLVARKPHRCVSCGEAIEVGARYVRWRSYDCGDATTSKMHPECYDMHNADGGAWEYEYCGHPRPTVAKVEE